MKIHFFMMSSDRKFDPNKPPEGFEPAAVSGYPFFARTYHPDGREDGGRDYTRFSAHEMRNWINNVAPGAAIVPNIEHIHERSVLGTKSRNIHCDIRISSGADIVKDMRHVDEAISAAIAAGAKADQLGIYGLAPTGYDVQNQIIMKGNMREIRAANDFLDALQPFLTLDRRHPSLYAATNDRNLWASVATFQIGECKRLGRTPVPFVGPMFHPSVWDRWGQLVPVEFFVAMLDQCEASGCPAVIAWQGYREIGCAAHIEAAQKWIERRKPKAVTMKASDQAPAFPGKGNK